MVTGIEFLELIYGQLQAVGIVRSKGEFSDRLLGKSPSYMTSMKAKKRVVSHEVIAGLGDNLMTNIAELGPDAAHRETRSVLRRAVAQVNNFLADHAIASEFKPTKPAAPLAQVGRFFVWLRAFAGHPIADQ